MIEIQANAFLVEHFQNTNTDIYQIGSCRLPPAGEKIDIRL